MANIFTRVPVQIPNRSGNDISHHNLLTLKTGELIPCFTKLMLPNDTIKVSTDLEVQLPPMVSDFYGYVEARIEHFFVPLRLLYGGWKDIVTMSPEQNSTPTIPSLNAQAQNDTEFQRKFGPGSLFDYLDFNVRYTATSAIRFRINNALRAIAYHKIYDDWYRDTRLTTQLFDYVPNAVTPTPESLLSRLPYTRAQNITISDTNKFKDGTDIYTIRKRCWDKDYFTSATTSPQAGNQSKVTIDTSGDTHTFSIAQLRAANSLQQWLERNNVAGYRYNDQIFANYGVYPSDAATDRALYLGQANIPIYNRGVYQSGTAGDNGNPFNSVGTKYGSSLGAGSFGFKEFTSTEHGYYMIIVSLVPKINYSSGICRDWSYTDISDIPNHMLQNIGDQEIYGSEINAAFDPNSIFDSLKTFGYIPRFSEHKFMRDEVHGELRDDATLKHFALQSSFVNPQLGTEFLEIPDNYLDGVMVANTAISKLSCWMSMKFGATLITTLSKQCIPTLDRPHDTHTVEIPNGGNRL